VVSVANGLAVGLAALVALLTGLSATVGLSVPAWLVGLACGVVMTVAVARCLGRAGVGALGPADKVTLTRCTISCAVAALVTDSLVRSPAVTTLVALATVALLLDAVDGRVARRTGTMSAFGARFDGEADAFLILVLSVYVARSVGLWVLCIGLARYAFAVAGWVLPWMRRQLPFRYWGKVVAAVQGIVLAFAAADVAPHPLTVAAVLVALALLTESFVWNTLWLWRQRSADRAEVVRTAVRVRPQVP
jgi:phosphatidylglycerophosphate synthase